VSASESACVSLSRFCPRGHFGHFTLFKFWAERYFKIPHFDNLFVLVHFVSFNCFTLRYLQVTFLLILPFFILQISPNFTFICKSVHFSFLFAERSFLLFFWQFGHFFAFLQFSPLILQICKKVLKSNSVQRPRRQCQYTCHIPIGS